MKPLGWVVCTLLSAASAGALLCHVEHAQAADATAGKKKIMIAAFTGEAGEDARNWVIEAVAVEQRAIFIYDDAAAGVAHGFEPDDFAAAAETFGAAAVVVGHLDAEGPTWRLDIYLHAGKDGSLISEFSVEAETKEELADKVKAEFIERCEEPLRLGSGAADSSPSPPPPPSDDSQIPEPTDAEDPFADDKRDAPKVEAEDPRPGPLDIRTGLRLYNRQFSYTHHISAVRPNEGFPQAVLYETSLANPAFTLAVDWYLLAHFTGGVAANIGIMGSYEFGFGAQTKFQDRLLTQDHSSLSVGPRYRISFGTHQIAPFVQWGAHDFVIGNDKLIIGGVETSEEGFPDVNYRFVDGGLDARFAFGSFNFGGHARYRFVYDAGGIRFSDWFPNTKASAIFGGIFIGYQITEIIGLQVAADYLQYGFDFNPVENPRYARRIAGGAIDRYASLVLGATMYLPGAE